MAGRDLLDATIEAHGGLARWRSARELVARVPCGGLALASRFKARAIRDLQVRVSTGEARTVFSPYPGPGLRGVFRGDAVRIESEAGAVLAERTNPRAALRKIRHQVWWDNLDLVYFAGYALWNYFCAPFLLLRPGFEVSEIEPSEEQGERWRRLRVVFPPDVPTHCRDQVFYFDGAGLL